jgi:mRNA-degrading endonuclease RelE of RelBE toxin-antitoxin system
MEAAVAFTIEIMPSALQELQETEVFYRRQIADAIDEQLQHQATTPTRNRKVMDVDDASFAFNPPLWELRIGDFRVFYDVDEETQTVRVRAIREKPPHATTEEIL